MAEAIRQGVPGLFPIDQRMFGLYAFKSQFGRGGRVFAFKLHAGLDRNFPRVDG